VTANNLYETLREALREQVAAHGLAKENVSIRCKALSAVEAIGNPEDRDYPIIKGREVMVEARFRDARGQAFADDFENADYSVEDLLRLPLDTNRRRASFVAGLNAVFRHLGLCEKTIHCKDDEPRECARQLPEIIEPGSKVLLVGLQPRLIESLASHFETRAVDLDVDNIGREIRGVVVEPADKTDEAIRWCDVILATGSTLVNGTISRFLDQDNPVIFFGVTISAAAKILGLKTYCVCGH